MFLSLMAEISSLLAPARSWWIFSASALNSKIIRFSDSLIVVSRPVLTFCSSSFVANLFRSCFVAIFFSMLSMRLVSSPPQIARVLSRWASVTNLGLVFLLFFSAFLGMGLL